MANERTLSGKSYVVALLALLVLTVVSLGVTWLELGALAPVVALGVASVKALIVLLVFMHLLEASFSMRIVALVSILFIVLLCLGVVADVAFR